MRPQASPAQEPGDQKKSVFDRLGRQLDTSRSINRGSPVHYGEHPMHQVMHEADFGRSGRPDQNPPDMNWRYQNDRRQMPFGRDRHPPPVNPFPPQYDMNMPPGRQPQQYFPHPHPHPHQAPYHANPNGPPPLIGPDVMAMGMHQRRPSPKYDRHGNPIRGAPMRMDMPSGMSPPRNFMGPPAPGPMMHPAGYDMVPMNPGMYPQNRWPENLEMGPPMHGRLAQDERFMEAQRFQQQQQQPQQQQPKPPVMLGPGVAGHKANFEATGRYSKWRERRDAITNLDRQTAQSSSKTDSLKSSLQQHEGRHHGRRRGGHRHNKHNDKQMSAKQDSNNTPAAATPKPKPPVAPPKTDPSEISDGEIVDDEDSSDESDNQKATPGKDTSNQLDESSATVRKTPYGRIATEGSQYFDSKKRRRLLDRDDYPMDYETISDEELDDFMSDNKLAEGAKLEGAAEGKSSSEIELLNALGLDWANLIELSRQSRKEAPTSGSALRRFSVPNYLPTLGITRELAGPEIYNFILKVCH